jgi:hypothetical protein
LLFLVIKCRSYKRKNAVTSRGDKSSKNQIDLFAQ